MEHNHDMPMDPMAKGTTMHMNLYWGKDAIILFSGWPKHSLGMYILALLLVFFLAMAAEILSIQRYGPVKRGTNPVAKGITQAAIYAIRMGFLYLVMLAVMSFNLGIFIAAIVGHTLGFFVVKSRAVAVANKENKDELPSSTIIPASNI
ncbi:hypothetical protein L6164_003443 [Bauhinia variegata]|uniref:Uncharacterized protein n=1 Tax=Bauhinia variegata TaxID=167791 RepID=A0ACB9Q1A3_BAUVA|nr:hypothetical protein L6164_003443 [Bauhinia variegata]